mmetsp:Transcript_16099/g.27202  ORF Transcript_16099/g.27202 Transcript_16099/m.27202 type:complete len:101 (-) Transcript_16099:30-332(-)
MRDALLLVGIRNPLLLVVSTMSYGHGADILEVIAHVMHIHFRANRPVIATVTVCPGLPLSIQPLADELIVKMLTVHLQLLGVVLALGDVEVLLLLAEVLF